MSGIRLAWRSLATAGVLLAFAVIGLWLDHQFVAIRENWGFGYILWFVFGTAFSAAFTAACAAGGALIGQPTLRSGRSYLLLLSAIVLAALLAPLVFFPYVE